MHSRQKFQEMLALQCQLRTFTVGKDIFTTFSQLFRMKKFEKLLILIKTR